MLLPANEVESYDSEDSRANLELLHCQEPIGNYSRFPYKLINYFYIYKLKNTDCIQVISSVCSDLECK